MALQAGREPRLDPGAVLQVAELLPAPRLPAQRALRDRVHCGEKAGRRSVHTHIYTHICIHTLTYTRYTHARSPRCCRLPAPVPEAHRSVRRRSPLFPLSPKPLRQRKPIQNYGMGTAARLSPAIRTALLSLTSFPITADVIGYGNV